MMIFFLKSVMNYILMIVFMKPSVFLVHVICVTYLIKK